MEWIPSRVKIIPDIDSITSLTKRRNEELKTRKEIGIETTDELRGFLPNRENVEGGNVVLVPANFIPIDEVSTDIDSNPGSSATLIDNE